MHKLSDKILFIAWSRIGRRTVELAKEVDAKLLLIADRPPYIRAWRKTKTIISKMRPKVIIAQLPQGPLLLRLVQLKNRMKFKLIADVHSGFVVQESLKGIILNKPFVRLLRYCDLIVAHNELQAKYMIEKLRFNKELIIIVYDSLPRIPKTTRKPNSINLDPDEKYLIMPASWDPDEPIDYIIRGYHISRIKKDYKLVITGRPKKRDIIILARKLVPDRIIFTGYLPWNEYYWLLSHANAVIGATTREYTMLSAVWEASALSIPLIISYTLTLREIVGDNALYFTLSEDSIAKSLDMLPYLENILRRKSAALRDRLARLSKESINELKNKLSMII